MGVGSRVRRASLVAFLAGVSLGCAISRAAPLEAYGRLPNLEQIELSPSGERLAFVRTAGDERVLAVQNLSDRRIVGGLKLGNTKIRWLDWADEDHLLIYWSDTEMPVFLTGGQSEYYHLRVYDLRRDEQVTVPNVSSLMAWLKLKDVDMMNTIAGVARVRKVDGRTVLFFVANYYDPRPHPMLIRYDLADARQTVLYQAQSFARRWYVDAEGRVVADSDYEEESKLWTIRVRQGGELKEVARGEEAIEVPTIFGFTADGGALSSWFHENDKWVWKSISLPDGTMAPIPGYHDADGALQGRLDDRLEGATYIEDETRYEFADSSRQAGWKAILRAFEGCRVRLVSHADDFSRVVVKVEAPAQGYFYFLIDLKTHVSKPLGEVYEGIDPPYETRRIDYKAADSLSIPAYLTLPRGHPEKGLPLVVLPHGGPAARDTADFDWIAQALASQGYAVLRPNYRGSLLGSGMLEAGYGEFGRKMQTDLSDGVRFLVAQGIVDPGRVCIVGGSYGGYAALAAVSLDPGPWRCAVSLAGLSDLQRMLHWVDERHYSGENLDQRYWDRFMGARDRNDPMLAQISPALHADAVKVPVLLVHGEDDTVVPFEQSRYMADALRAAGRPVELVRLEGEDHWLSRSATRARFLRVMVDFLKKENPPDAAPAGAATPERAAKP